VKLAFEPKRGAAGDLKVTAPRLPAQAVPGVYMLYVLDKRGGPSLARQVRIRPDNSGSTTPFR
jgi:hypothetical protein